jgi:hypothetical protein
MQTVIMPDGRKFVVCEVLKSNPINDILIQKIEPNKKYDVIIKNGDSFLLCDEIIDASWEISTDSDINSTSKLKGNNVDISM